MSAICVAWKYLCQSFRFRFGCVFLCFFLIEVVGCAVGASAFELSKTCQEVVGIDFSQHFIDAANEMKTAGEMSYRVMEQGTIFSDHIAKLPADSVPERIVFLQGDACNLREDIGEYS